MPIKKPTTQDYLERNQKLNNILPNRKPAVSALMANSVSSFRKEALGIEVEQGLYKDGSSTPISSNYSHTSASNVTASGISKIAQISNTSGANKGSFGDTTMQVPEVYSPLWLNSNLNLPRDKATINAWCRAFFVLNPFVNNAISLHSTYPISKLNIKCANKTVEKFFNDMIEELDIMNLCVQIAQEYWLLGEAFVYAELDQNKGKWDRFVIQNPDYMVVKRTVSSSEPLIMLRPDENLKRVVMSNKPSDIEQKKQLNSDIIDKIKKGENIPMNSFNISHLARKISPYEIRGTGLPVCIFRQLMLFDKLRESKFAQADNMVNPLTLVKVGGGAGDYKPTAADLESWRDIFECHDEDTEVLTQDGFKKFNEVIEYNESLNINNPICQATPKKNVKIACFNPENEQLEYHEPLNASLYNYSGDMYHYSNNKIDIKVTPNHKMWVSNKEYQYNGHRSLRKTKWSQFKKVKAQDLSLKDYSRFRSKINWVGKDDQKFVNINKKEIPIEIYLEYLGYLLSEGCLYTNNKSMNTVGICQSFKKFQKEMLTCVDNFSQFYQKPYSQSIRKAKQDNHSDVWSATFCSKDLFNFFKQEIADEDGNVKSFNKRIPAWVKELSPRLLKILLKSLVMGDGSSYINPKKTSNRFAYYTTSKQLADDVYEISYKCGYVPTMFVRDEPNYLNRSNTPRKPLYTLTWSDSVKGNFPYVYKTYTNSETKQKQDILKIENYTGKVWCFEVPTGLFITRRNGKITIQGNSAQHNKDFKIFTHEGVSVEKIGSGSGIYDTSGDISQLVKEIYTGLQVPSVLMDGGSDVTYANGGVALDVLRQRYMQFRNMLSLWLKRKIFAPISKIHGFYEFKKGSGKSEKHLIVPEVDWNHMSLFDAGDYINNLVTLSQGDGESQRRVSLHTLYRSLGLEWEDEQLKMRKEAIASAIAKKEKMALEQKDLSSLRTLTDEDEIEEESSEGGMPSGPTGGPGESLPGEAPPGGMAPPPPLPGLNQ